MQMTDLITELRHPESVLSEPYKSLGQLCGEAADEIIWLRLSLVSLLALAEAKPSPLTTENVAAICRLTLSEHGMDVDQWGRNMASRR
jgi:hypothetical protein